MIEGLASRIASIQTTRPRLVIALFVIVTLLLAPGITLLVGHVEPSLEKVLPQHIEEVETMNMMRTEFGADMMYLVVYPLYPVSDVRDPQLLDYIDTLAQQLRTRELVASVQSASDLVTAANNGVIPNALTETKELFAKHPRTHQYMNRDYSLSVIHITSMTGNSAELISELMNDITTDIATLEGANPGARIEITGFNAIDKATFDVIISDFSSITLISFALIAVIVIITFGSFIRGFFPLVVVMTALLWTMGVVGYLGLTITVVSMVAAAMIMGLGIDFGIHMVHTYFEHRKKHQPKAAVHHTLQELLLATTSASATTIAGFLALLFGVLPAMKNLAIILALGIFGTLIGATLLLPTLLYMYDSRTEETP